MLVDLDEDQVEFLKVLGGVNNDISLGRPTKAPEGWDEGRMLAALVRLLPKLHKPTEGEERRELIEGYAYYRANSAVRDSENCTSYTEEFQAMARQLAERMTDEELAAYLKEHEDEN